MYQQKIIITSYFILSTQFFYLNTEQSYYRLLGIFLSRTSTELVVNVVRVQSTISLYYLSSKASRDHASLSSTGTVTMCHRTIYSSLIHLPGHFIKYFFVNNFMVTVKAFRNSSKTFRNSD